MQKVGGDVLERVIIGRQFVFTFSCKQADLATERERQLTTARANQTTGLTILTNGRAAN